MSSQLYKKAALGLKGSWIKQFLHFYFSSAAQGKQSIFYLGTKVRWVVRNTLTAEQLANEMQIAFIRMAKARPLPSEI